MFSCQLGQAMADMVKFPFLFSVLLNFQYERKKYKYYMYIFSKIIIKQTRFSASRWSLCEVCMFNIHIFLLHQNFVILK